MRVVQKVGCNREAKKVNYYRCCLAAAGGRYGAVLFGLGGIDAKPVNSGRRNWKDGVKLGHGCHDQQKGSLMMRSYRFSATCIGSVGSVPTNVHLGTRSSYKNWFGTPSRHSLWESYVMQVLEKL
jgi:hypothetical protein